MDTTADGMQGLSDHILDVKQACRKDTNGSHARPALERGVPQPEASRRRGMVMEATAILILEINWYRTPVVAQGPGA